MNEISSRMIKIRDSLGWKNVDLAREAEVSKQAVNKWLNEGAIPGATPLMKLRQKHEINDIYILSGKGPMFLTSKTDSDPELNAIIAVFPDLTADQKKRVAALVQDCAAAARQQK